MKEERGRVPDLILEQFALGELPAAEEAGLRRAMGDDPSIRSRLDDIRKSDARILEEYPSAEMAARIRARLERVAPADEAVEASRFRPSPGRRAAAAAARRAAIPAAAAFLAIAGALAFKGGLGSPASDLALTRAKGSGSGLAAGADAASGDGAAAKGIASRAALRVFRKTATGTEELADGSRAAGGDLLQLSYSAGGARYGAILSVDGRGSVTFHLPQAYSGGAASSPELDARPLAALGSAYELDDAPSYERFIFVLSSRPFQLSELYEGARRLAGRADAASAALALGSGLEQRSVLLRKEGSSR
jgi:hypothetical protein